MAHRVLELPSAERDRLNAVLNRDDVSRQSVTLKDAKSFDLDRAGLVVILEGDEGVLAAAAEAIEAIGGRVPPEADAIWEAYQAENDAAAGGMGFVFG